jgi:cytochrome c5
MKPILIALLIVASVACTTQIYAPTEANVNKVQPATLAELQQGHDLFQTKCGKCHKLPQPGKHAKDDWTKILVKMAPKAKLTAEQSDLVYKYVVNN